MESRFPKSHYTAELWNKYDVVKNNNAYDILRRKFNEDNIHHNNLLAYLAKEHTEGSISKLINKISDNYESYYLADNKQCLDSVICGTFFPEYTESLTKNSNFSDALTQWTKINGIDEVYSNGKVEYIPTKNYVELEFVADVPSDVKIAPSGIDLYQLSLIDSTSFEDYFFFFDLADLYGGAGGFVALSGVYNSGIAGAYTCFKDKDKNNLGCLTWSDHLNKKFVIPSHTSEGIKFLNRLLPTDTFYNTDLRNVFRRVSERSFEERFSYTGNLAEILKKYLPKVYAEKNNITFVEYGIFASELRNDSGYCYNCEARVKAYEVKLLKVKR
jgi:hypothetical protein